MPKRKFVSSSNKITTKNTLATRRSTQKKTTQQEDTIELEADLNLTKDDPVKISQKVTQRKRNQKNTTVLESSILTPQKPSSKTTRKSKKQDVQLSEGSTDNINMSPLQQEDSNNDVNTHESITARRAEEPYDELLAEFITDDLIMSFTVNYLDKFEGWESALDPNSLSLLEILEFRRTKKDFSFDKWTEHFTISKFVSYVAKNTTNEKWKIVFSVLDDKMLKTQAQGEDVKSFWRKIETEKIESENNLLEAKIKQAEVQFSVDRTLTGNEAHRIIDQKKIDYVLSSNKNSIGEDKVVVFFHSFSILACNKSSLSPLACTQIRTVTLEEEESSTKGKMDMSLGHKRPYDEELPSTSSKKISSYENEELAEEDITQEDVLNSIAEVSDVFGKTKFPTYYNKLKSILHNRDAETNYYVIDLGDEEILNQRLRLTDEDECLSTEACRYMTLFDKMIEEESCNDGKIEDEENYTTGERNCEELERKVHQLDSLPKKFHYLSNTLPIPAESYDQSETPDVFVIKSVSCHIDTITKMNGLMKSTPERTWTAHVLAYIFFVTFCFIDSLQYFSCERDISTKIDAQDDRYKADGVLELFERPRQIPLFLLEVSEGPNNPDPDKIKGDRTKLMNEGVFALNKFMMCTELPEWKVCEALGVFLAQGFADKVEIGQIIFIGPGLYLFSPFTVPALTIPTSNTNLKHAPRLIRTLLCLRYNTIEKIEKFNELEKEGQQRIVKPITKYATGVTPGRSRVVTFSQFLPKISRENSKELKPSLDKEEARTLVKDEFEEQFDESLYACPSEKYRFGR
ncbi:hypothetical protein C1646_748518 [Rhizophagus diaphanus]|nr:hypothetical protein C1646_748518 [Rhizophagus diaphanus] [Rhizophagus sp. MUCL 43196]